MSKLLLMTHVLVVLGGVVEKDSLSNDGNYHWDKYKDGVIQETEAVDHQLQNKKTNVQKVELSCSCYLYFMCI